MLLRDVANLRAFFGRFAPELLATAYGAEIWDQYQRGVLHPDAALSGRFDRALAAVDMGGVLREIDDARAEEAARRLRLQAAR
jgi:RIO kinase 1